MSKYYMIGNTHFDPVWEWKWDEAMSSIMATFRSALDRMSEYPDFIYSFSSPPVFEWINQKANRRRKMGFGGGLVESARLLFGIGRELCAPRTLRTKIFDEEFRKAFGMCVQYRQLRTPRYTAADTKKIGDKKLLYVQTRGAALFVKITVV